MDKYNRNGTLNSDIGHFFFFFAGLLHYANMNDESLAENIVYVAIPNLLATE